MPGFPSFPQNLLLKFLSKSRTYELLRMSLKLVKRHSLPISMPRHLVITFTPEQFDFGTPGMTNN